MVRSFITDERINIKYGIPILLPVYLIILYSMILIFNGAIRAREVFIIFFFSKKQYQKTLNLDDFIIGAP